MDSEKEPKSLRWRQERKVRRALVGRPGQGFAEQEFCQIQAGHFVGYFFFVIGSVYSVVCVVARYLPWGVKLCLSTQGEKKRNSTFFLFLVFYSCGPRCVKPIRVQMLLFFFLLGCQYLGCVNDEVFLDLDESMLKGLWAGLSSPLSPSPSLLFFSVSLHVS